MKKQIMLFIMVFAFILALCGTVSAVTPKEIGQNVTQQALADSKLNMQHSDKNLVITTASTAHFNKNTTEKAAQAVVDITKNLAKGQKITYGSGNLLTINDPHGSLWFAFISKTGNNLMAKIFTVSSTGRITASKTVNIGTTQTSAKFKEAITTLGTKGYNIAAIANLWAAGAPADLLATTYSTKTINAGIMSNYAIIKQFQQNYPLGSNKTNYVFSNAGGLDDDAALFGFYDFSYELYTMTGGDSSKMAIMQYDSTSKTGVLILMRMNNLVSQFTAQTGIKVVDGTWSEIKYNLWLFNLLKTNLSALYTVTGKKSVNEAAYKYIWYDSSLGYGHGLVGNYIAGLPNLTTTYDQSQNVIPVTAYETMYDVGQNAVQLAMTALGYTSEQAFITDISEGKIGVIATPYYENFNDVSLAGLLDGINYSGAFTISNLLTDTHPWNHSSGVLKILFFKVTHKDLVNSANTTFVKKLITITQTAGVYNYSTGEGTGPGYITLMPLAFAQGVSWDFMRVFFRVGCPRCISEDYTAANFGLKEFPLGANEQYFLMSIPVTTASAAAENWEKMANVRMGLFGVSPSLGTYLSMGGQETSTATQYAEYILIRWDYVTNTGIAALIMYDSTKVAELMAADGYDSKLKWNWYIDKVFKDSSYLDKMFSVVWQIPLNVNSLAVLTGEGKDPVSYLSHYISIKASVNTASGLYNKDQTITLTADPGATIYYTLDGTTPTTNSLIYTGPITISRDTTLTFTAMQNNYFSPIYTKTYAIDKVAPDITVSSPGGTYNQDQTITLTAESGTTIYYTLDGTTPTTNSLIYTGPITISKNTILQYIAVDKAGNISPVYTQAYTIDKTPAVPTNPTNPSTTIGQITGAIISAITSTETTPTNTEIAPGLPGETNPTNTNTPIETIIGTIILAIAAILIYLGKNTIIATIKGTEKLGK